MEVFKVGEMIKESWWKGCERVRIKGYEQNEG